MGFNLFGASSESSTTQTTQNYDQRVAADNAGIAIGPGSSYSNNFSDAVANVLTKMIDFSAGTVSKAVDTTQQALTANTALSTAATNNAQLGQSSLLTNPTLVWGVVLAVAAIAYFRHRG
jgi:hypothetical protein